MTNKFLTLGTLATVLAFTIACKENPNEIEASEAAAAAVATTEAISYNVDTDLSSIAWVGSSPTDAHTGNLSIASGIVKVLSQTLQSGEFVIDMASIEVTDIEGEQATKLKAHLEGTRPGVETDFFDISNFPTAKFVVTSVKSVDGKNMLEGNLTLKNVTKNVAFPVNVSYDGNKMMLTSEQFTIDRTDWGIQYGSQKFSDQVLNSAISDDIKLTINLVAKKA
jgi:polyisoprenoid-binding protein YceI